MKITAALQQALPNKQKREFVMERLTHKTLIESGYNGFIQPDAPERVLQFGEGNFMRAFVDYFFDISNEKAGFNGKVSSRMTANGR